MQRRVEGGAADDEKLEYGTSKGIGKAGEGFRDIGGQEQIPKSHDFLESKEKRLWKIR